MEKDITIKSGPIRLEGRFFKGSEDRAAVITHPHPLYGGNMDSPVVLAAQEAFLEKGFSTLRFNFRGTGESTGMFDDGKGERTDVIKALAFVHETGIPSIHLAGYSFGAWVNAGALAENSIEVADHIMVSPPVAFLNFDDITESFHTGLVVTGSDDTIAPPGLIRKYLEKWNSDTEIKILDGCDHFYAGFTETLTRTITAYL
ncbi:MAG: alpha/beta hydrolase [Desulfobacteraceae bacterium]